MGFGEHQVADQRAQQVVGQGHVLRRLANQVSGFQARDFEGFVVGKQHPVVFVEPNHRVVQVVNQGFDALFFNEQTGEVAVFKFLQFFGPLS